MPIYAIMKIDPTQLEEGDVVIEINEHEPDGCHCDVLVTVKRYVEGE